MSKAVRELCEKIMDGTTTYAPACKFEKTPDWLLVNKALFNSRELVPGWMENRNKEIKVENKVATIDFEAERQKVLAKLYR